VESRPSAPEPRPSAARQLRAIGPLPATATLVAPLILCLTSGTNVGLGLPGAAAALPVLAGALLVAAGLRLVVETIALFARRGRGTLAPWDPTTRLVAEGPYRRVRNPMISGVFTVLLGEAIVIGTPAMFIWCGAFALVNAIYMPLMEEPGLASRFGEDYLTYKRNVPRWIPRRTPWLPLLALAALCAMPGSAPAQEAGAGEISTRAIGGSPAEVRDYWTPERMRTAEPLDAPAGPATAATSVAPSLYAQAPDQEIPASRDLLYPERIHGRLFLTYGTSDASCSATVVTSRARNLILTAGHCVALPGAEGSQPTFATNVVFVPGYRNGARPFGTYVATSLRTPVLWAFEADLTFDVGAINLAPLSGGQIEDVLGSRGLSFNRGASGYKKNRTPLQLFGYPAQPAAFYDGERPILCNSTFRGFEGFTLALVAAPCNMKEGSSGGGVVLKGGLVNAVISHNACGLDPNCTAVSNTYFGNAAFKLWTKAGGGLSKGQRKRLRGCKNKRGAKKTSCVRRAETFRPTLR